ncbi:adenylyl-sulfate kinase [Desulfovibrio sp.]|uniref:adenylyl-sulfate kinase n=1 Tax=Desulfovibrio sp. TaxID=885 RepID=UPI0025C4207E|nr:adenylyl-sulfate kinase [Desulfovibrio sp.]
MTPVIWLLGLSGSGKTTLGSLVRLFLEGQGVETAFVDENHFRRQTGLDGIAPQERITAMNALRDQALQHHAQGRVCIVAATTPYSVMRQKNRKNLPLYHEVWVRCSLQTLVTRDTRGLYAMAGQGHVPGLSGLTDRFDEPLHADHIIDTDRHDLAESYLILRNLALDALTKARHWNRLAHALPATVLAPMPVRERCIAL